MPYSDKEQKRINDKRYYQEVGKYRSYERYKNDEQFRQSRADTDKRSRERTWQDVFNAYGGDHCVLCGATDRRVLCIDHVNGDGAAQRKAMNNIHGYKLAAWLRRHGFPNGYRILCYNCNWREAIKMSNARGSNTQDAIISKRRRTERRQLVISAYGGKCVECGETDPIVLTLCHKDGPTFIKTLRYGYVQVYQEAIKRNYPDDFKLYCFNCQEAAKIERTSRPTT